MGKRSIIATNIPKGIWPFTQGQLIYEPVAIAIVAGAAYGVGFLLNEQWTAVPLAATIVTTATEPAAPEASFTQGLKGNLAALMIAFVTIRTLGLEHGYGIDILMNFHPIRAVGVLSAMVATAMACTLLGIIQPAAAATAAFLVFCGVTPTPHTALALTAEILLVTALGDIMRRWRVRGAPVK